MKKLALVCTLGSLLMAGAYANAENADGHVTSLGCHNVDNVCYVTLDGYPGSSFCNRTNSIRWDAGSTWGRRWYATFLAASMTGKSVSLYMDDGSCGPQGYPTFLWGTLY